MDPTRDFGVDFGGFLRILGAFFWRPGEAEEPPGASRGFTRLRISEGFWGGGGLKRRLGAFVSSGGKNVYLTSSKATNKYKKLLGKELPGC